MKNLNLITTLFLYLVFNSALLAQTKSPDYAGVINARVRVIVDNDFGGDPDGLFQLAHHLLSPSVEVKGIVGSKHYDGGFYDAPGDAKYSCKMVNELLAAMHMTESYSALEGASYELPETLTPIVTEGAEAIVREAMRTDTDKPLYVVCGAGLTNIASAFLMEPKIAERLTLIWIGGTEYEGIADPPPGASKRWEYNTGIDVKACQVVFNQSSIPIWQIPRDAYRQALTSYSELIYKVKGKGEAGNYLVGRLEHLMKQSNKSLGEAYVLGDSPLVLLTALQSSWESDPASSKYKIKPAPTVTDSGMFEENSVGREIRVYYDLDIRLMFEDFFAKLSLFNDANQK
ncbi:nucleoside hydrolase [Draconibacterium sp. IB214405]|uniref:nucleoside hydrolase n=1 Tax=Draconibacterium sp. IB214405 TaxID=3097352 RepID=UPI002A0F36C1|nr:nucleoside hydrolase [Draconibacterium sp. IB214405]MDX8337545.1 nucleoside hydrolase [Draconibacterium sp. IB214405]